MPTPYIKKLAKLNHTSVKTIEKYWDEAKEIASGKWALVTHLFQKKLKAHGYKITALCTYSYDGVSVKASCKAEAVSYVKTMVQFKESEMKFEMESLDGDEYKKPYGIGDRVFHHCLTPIDCYIIGKVRSRSAIDFCIIIDNILFVKDNENEKQVQDLKEGAEKLFNKQMFVRMIKEITSTEATPWYIYRKKNPPIEMEQEFDNKYVGTRMYQNEVSKELLPEKPVILLEGCNESCPKIYSFANVPFVHVINKECWKWNTPPECKAKLIITKDKGICFESDGSEPAEKIETLLRLIAIDAIDKIKKAGFVINFCDGCNKGIPKEYSSMFDEKAIIKIF